MKELYYRILYCQLVVLFGLAVTVLPVNAEDIPSPSDYLGFEVGTDYHLADYGQIREYFHLLDLTSPLIRLVELGQTTEGRSMVLVIITSSFNQNNLAKIREAQVALSDPRKISEAEAVRFIRQGKAVVSINCSIHANEIGASQMAMELAYRLISSESEQIDKILENVVILLIPAQNPDGIDKVVEWYRRYLGSEYEGGAMPWMYHLYTGHDLNRDWVMLTQRETRLTVEKVYNQWFPHIVFDLHQMGGSGARLFVPPYTNPVDPNVDPILQAEITAVGANIASDLIARGKSGVIVNAIFDAFSPSRAYPNYHGGIRILLEAASAKVASPVNSSSSDLRVHRDYNPSQPSWNQPLPWSGGTWQLRNIVDYEEEACMSVLTYAANYRSKYLRNSFQVAKNSVAEKETPYAVVFPRRQNDPTAMRDLVRVLQRGLVEVHQAMRSFEVGGVPYSRGSVVIPMAQPFGYYARTLLVNDPYPNLKSCFGQPPQPYDVTAHNLPLLFGVKAKSINKKFDIDLIPVDSTFFAPGRVVEGIASNGYVIDHRDNGCFRALSHLLTNGAGIYWLSDNIEVRGERWPPGTIWVRSVGSISNLNEVAKQTSVDFVPVDRITNMNAFRIREPRIGLYQSWLAISDEGWTRWIFDDFEISYTTLHDVDIRAGNLDTRFDVIILPSQTVGSIVNGASEDYLPPEYCGGISQSGVENLKEFVEKGGTLIAMDKASELPIKHFWISVQNVLDDSSLKDVNARGVILRILVNNRHPIGYGMPHESSALYFNSPVFKVISGEKIAQYPMSDPLLSGWMSRKDYLSMNTAVAEVPVGTGRVVLLGLRSQFRAQARSTFKLLLNSIYYATAEQVKVP